MKQKIKYLNFPFAICIFSMLLLSLYTSVKLYDKNKVIENTFRLHVVANSNSIEDQIVKLKIVDKVENYISNLLNEENLTKQGIYDSLNSHVEDILLISNNELKENKKDYTAIAKLGKIYYEEKENIYNTMDEGSYDSLQIALGKAEGKNYWNLIFPNKDNVKKLEGLENILPGISTIYEEEELKDTDKVVKTYTFKFLEVFEKIF